MKSLRKKYDIVLFDLDGTVAESAPGIRAGLTHVIEQMGLDAVDLDDYSQYIGPPLMQTFQKLLHVPGEQAEQAQTVYQTYYNAKGKYRNKLYSGIDTVLKALADADCTAAVCSSKYEPFAQEVVQYLGVDHLFHAVCGSDNTGKRMEKEDVIPYALKTLQAPANAKAVLVGDTKFDAKGARLTGIDFIGVLYGYGTKAGMLQEGAHMFAETPEGLYTHLFY